MIVLNRDEITILASYFFLFQYLGKESRFPISLRNIGNRGSA
ncbi:hypothetical protein NC99_42820 [Sunxiuqinia dokdonensis]|uniref:Uncharacterized protein n=1 Tax=Sunxiuqinia dokdonensis TaxID=1409788 RepID=A0A0L8V341_9BACT|nr:hypothetical protein NC99_42820 [Sunxiuqinia dokdonensis]